MANNGNIKNKFVKTAIVVTYNRKLLLMRCLAAVDSQTCRPDRILVVDNASSDDTVKQLRESGWLARPDFKLLQLDRNLGGAGGFAEGWKQAMTEATDWLWMMDDDGYPAADCLEKLLSEANQRNIEAISPVQADIDDVSQPAFPTIDMFGKPVTQLPYIPPNGDFFIPLHANLFNGLLIKKDTAKRVGLPRAELFIRGDEVEYVRRLTAQRVRFGTLASAYFYHPSDQAERHRFLFGFLFARDAKNDFKNYYMYRNKGLAFRENRWLWMLPFDGLRYVYYFLIYKRGDFDGLRLWVRAMRDGLSKKLGRHPDF